jgi:hypothetical protein
MRCNVARRRRASLARSPTLEGSEAPGGARRGGEVGGEARVGVAEQATYGGAGWGSLAARRGH